MLHLFHSEQKSDFFRFFITQSHFNALQSDFEISENKNEIFFKNMLDVSNGFVYSLPRTHYGAARKSKPTVNVTEAGSAEQGSFQCTDFPRRRDRRDAEPMVNLP